VAQLTGELYPIEYFNWVTVITQDSRDPNGELDEPNRTHIVPHEMTPFELGGIRGSAKKGPMGWRATFGTPGTLSIGACGTGQDYLVSCLLPSRENSDDFVGAAATDEAKKRPCRMNRLRRWTVAQVKNYEKINYKVADKGVESVVVDMQQQKALRGPSRVGRHMDTCDGSTSLRRNGHGRANFGCDWIDESG